MYNKTIRIVVVFTNYNNIHIYIYICIITKNIHNIAKIKKIYKLDIINILNAFKYNKSVTVHTPLTAASLAVGSYMCNGSLIWFSRRVCSTYTKHQ